MGFYDTVVIKVLPGRKIFRWLGENVPASTVSILFHPTPQTLVMVWVVVHRMKIECLPPNKSEVWALAWGRRGAERTPQAFHKKRCGRNQIVRFNDGKGNP